MHDFTGQRVVVMGLGRFGGGVGVTRYLVSRGASVRVTDSAPAATLQESVARLSDLSSITFRLGEHREADFTDADLIVANPAVQPETNPYLVAARRAATPITSEIRLLIEQLPDRKRVIGVTGSAGKSTVTAMIGRALHQADLPPGGGRGNTWIGGNLGGSLLSQVDQITARDRVVLELSSFMLHGLAEDRWSPGTAVVTNLSPNHLDWHGSFERYLDAKRTILAYQSADDLAVLGPGVGQTISPGRAQTFHVEHLPNSLGELAVPGPHNQLNAALALRTLDLLGIDRDQSVGPLQTFPGLAHRLQRVAEHNGVSFYNDSKSTTPDAAMRAIDSFEPRTVHAILGGYDKGSDLTPLARFAAERSRAIYTLGQTGPAIADAARACGGEGGESPATVVAGGDLDSAVHAAINLARRGEVVLLSPGCASWDQFEHFEKRGHRFTQAVLQFTTETGHRP